MKKFDPRLLPYMGALVQSGLFGIAGYHYFKIGIAGAVAGAGVGLVVNFSIATASSKISEVAKKRQALSWAAFVLLCVISPIVINASLGWSVATVAWSVAVDLSIVLTGAIIGKGLVKQEETTATVAASSDKPSQAPGKRKGKLQQVERKPMTDEALLAYLASKPGATQQQVADFFGVKRQAVGPRVKKLYEVKQGS
jgi:hypothetical protein